jgi:hypothetical protein
MAEHSEVFISATTRDLASYRREVKDALLSLQIFPIEESTFTLAYGSLTEMLCALISRCDAVIHLAGFSYGAPSARSGSAAPPLHPTGVRCGPGAWETPLPVPCQRGGIPEEGEEERALQLAHWHAIERCKDVYYPFTIREDLRSRVRELRLPARSARASGRQLTLRFPRAAL